MIVPSIPIVEGYGVAMVALIMSLFGTCEDCPATDLD
jgi:hypothetical protein